MSARPQRQCPHCPPHSHLHGALPWCSRSVSGSSCSGQLDEEPGCSLSPVPVCLPQRLAGATLLIFANKQDLPGALSSNAIREVSSGPWRERGTCWFIYFKSIVSPAVWQDLFRALEGL